MFTKPMPFSIVLSTLITQHQITTPVHNNQKLPPLPPIPFLYSFIPVFSTIAVKLATPSGAPPRNTISLVPTLDPSSFHRAV